MRNAQENIRNSTPAETYLFVLSGGVGKINDSTPQKRTCFAGVFHLWCLCRELKRPGITPWFYARDFNTPPTPRVVSYPLRLPPINWFQKGNKKPRVVSGVQILKDKRLGWDRQRSTLSAPNWVPIPSTLKSLTAVFGMGTGVASSELLSVSFQPLK